MAAGLLTGISYGLIVWVWSGLHVNIVIINYLRAGAYFWQGLDPYVETLRFGASNQFKYSPLFAMAVAPLVALTPQVVLRIWVLSGAFIFWLGVMQWVRMARTPWWLLVALLVCTVELVTSLGIYQINALVIGVTLLGLAACREGRVATGGALLMLATNIKVFPVIFLLPCLRRGGWKYIIGAVVIGWVTFLLPAVVVGLKANIALHTSWFAQITHDTVGSGILDVRSAWERLGAPRLGWAALWLIGCTSVPLFGLAAAAKPKPTVRAPQGENARRTELSREYASSGKILVRGFVFSKTCELCSFPSSHHFRESCCT